MSDLLTPVGIGSVPLTQEQRELDRNRLLADIRTELRILNTQIQIGLNSTVDVDLLRQDPFYTT